jgi:hypothetical protein
MFWVHLWLPSVVKNIIIVCNNIIMIATSVIIINVYLVVDSGI